MVSVRTVGDAGGRAAMHRPTLDSEDLMDLYAVDGRLDKEEEDGSSSSSSEDSEGSDEGRSAGGPGVRSSLSLEIHGLQREQPVYFSNREYYRRLEELKSNHLRNMAELERLYVSQAEERLEGGGGEARLSLSRPVRRLQRINSQEELDFHDTSSGSDQSELCAEDGAGELVWTSSSRGFLLSPEMTTTTGQKPRGGASFQSAARRVRSGPGVTVPKPFRMMLREEERKRNKARTRSEVELENALLKRELEELRECQKKFRASPAPAHIHLPLYDAISRRTGKRCDRSRSGGSSSSRDARGSPVSAAAPSRPFQFLERERRKREAKIEAQLGNFGRKVEPHAFKARPVPGSVYAAARASREVTEGRGDPRPSDLEPQRRSSSSSSASSSSSTSSASSRPVKKQMEVSIEMVKEDQWPCSGLQAVSPLHVSV